MEEDLANVTESLVQTTEEQIYDTLKNPGKIFPRFVELVSNFTRIILLFLISFRI